MSTYVIGDVQGCFQELEQLLNRIGPGEEDELWFVGDLVNRGPENREVMDLVLSLPNANCVIGNHDFHFLAVAEGLQTQKRSDTMDDLLESPNLEDYIEYFRHRPLLHHDVAKDVVIVHAGLPPQLDIQTCKNLANEVETCLQSKDYRKFLVAMYGNEPARFTDDLMGMERLRVITNCLARIRYCTKDGDLELDHKADIQPEGFAPWFSFGRDDNLTVVFGHWAALGGKADAGFVRAVDTGCVWGRELSAIKLEDETWFSVPAKT